jgi:hypothetical protein
MAESVLSPAQKSAEPFRTALFFLLAGSSCFLGPEKLVLLVEYQAEPPGACASGFRRAVTEITFAAKGGAS